MTIPRGRANPPKPIGHDGEIIRLKGCPDCDGRGWFLINPFATGGGNGFGGPANLTQCQTCLHAHDHWEKTGELPAEIAAEMGAACD